MNDVLNATLYNPLVMRERFITSVQQTINNSSDAVHIRAKLLDVLGRRSPALFGSPDALLDLSNMIFGDEVLRGWVFDTKFVFFMNVSGGSGMATLKALIQDLAWAASENMGIDNEEGFLNADEVEASTTVRVMNKDLLDELPTDSMVKTVLTVNTWLIVMLLLFAFIDLDHDVLKSPAELVESKKRKQVATP